MLVLAIVVGVLILIALLRFGVAAVYGEDGLLVKAKVGPISIKAYPRKEKAEKKKKGKRKDKKKGRARKAKKPEEEKPGAIEGFFTLLSAIRKVLGRVRRRLLIKKLFIHYVSASDDPVKTALMFGGSSAALDGILPMLEQNFRIRKRELRTSADFESSKPRIYVNAAVSIAVWEAVYIFFAILPVIAAIKNIRRETDGKDVENDGKTPDQ